MRIDKDYWLLNKPVAHRGLWGKEIVENSLSAYKNAAERGLPIEIDVYLTTDGKIVSFHDAELKRMTGADGKIYEKTYAELSELNLSESSEKIPLLDEVLSIAENKSPLLIEIKNQPNKKIVDRLVEKLKNYKGEFAVQSFNPLYIKRVKKLAPEFIRGILATSYKPNTKDKSAFTRWVLKYMPFNFLIKPDFISYNYHGLPLPKRKTKNKAVIAWTVTDQQTADKIKPFCNNIIFEHFLPDNI